MKENLQTSLEFCLKSRRIIELIIELMQKQGETHPKFSDEVQLLIDTFIEVSEDANILLEEVLVCLNERQQIFGDVGIEKQLYYEEGGE